MTFTKWLDTLIEEKRIDLDKILEVPGAFGLNLMPVGVVVEAIKSAPAHEQAKIKTVIVKLDFANAPIVPFFAYLAKAIAI